MSNTTEPLKIDNSPQLPVAGPDLQFLFDQIAANLSRTKHLPGATYRMQFNKFFTFKDAAGRAEYLHRLGITDLYASPYLRASLESLHGYDICDHNQLNPGIGTPAEYEQMCEELQKRGLGQILDIVPNHMGITETCNQWWMDVLENGPSSIYANFFDIDWKPVKDELENKVLIPILGNQYGAVLERGEFKVTFVAADGIFYLDYWEHRQPLNPRTYPEILRLALDVLNERLGLTSEYVLELQSIITNLGYLPPRWEKDYLKVIERNREKEILKRRLATLCSASSQVSRAIETAVSVLNGTPGDSASFDQLDQLIEAQAFRPAYWRVAADEINYRRFFDVNELAAIRVENPAVFEQSHRLIFQLIEQGRLQGLRVDHADGLWDPAGYLWNLQRTYFLKVARKRLPELVQHEVSDEEWQELVPGLEELLEQELLNNPASPVLKGLYVVTEKILEAEEALPQNWKVDGTSGYDFLNQVNNLLVDSSNVYSIEDVYTQFVDIKWRYSDLVYSRKAQISRSSLASEINVLGRLLSRISEQDRRFRDFTLNNLRFAIREVIACFPVYRTYTVSETGQVEKRDQAYIENAVREAKRRNPARDGLVFDYILDLLLLRLVETAREVEQALQREFIMKFQQVTGPVMAKGLEDTTFYLYNRLVSLNEVGANPQQFGQSIAAFHQQNLQRLQTWPHALLTTSTHDTKRSEDVRARINVLSEMPQEWGKAIYHWGQLNNRYRIQLGNKLAPDRNDEYLLYQTLLGVWPFDEPSEPEYAEFVARIQAYMIKALREAKFNTSWLNPNQAYEGAVHDFVAGLLNRDHSNLFLKGFKEFQVRTAHFGIFNSLSQLLLKITSPGVPDFYQGTELWDLSLVDPDNRRQVDYQRRSQLLEQLPRPSQTDRIRQLVANKTTGAIKLYLTTQALHYRQANRELFDRGDYQPLKVQGQAKDYICAFARSLNEKSVITVVPRLLCRLTGNTLVNPLGTAYWHETSLEVPQPRYYNLLTGETVEALGGDDGQYQLPAENVFANFPIALLERL